MYSALVSISKLPEKSIIKAIRICNLSSKNVKLSKKRSPRRHFRNLDSGVPNPGIQKQLDNLDPIDRMAAETNYVEDMESDFMQLHKMHELHESEVKQHNKFIQRKMVGYKYFKPKKNPNLLTWAEKEQIRYLHDSDDEKWCVENLARSFPASEEIVEKILKQRWQPGDSTRILKHDEAVERNWDLLRKGKLELDPKLKQHILQFTDRIVPSKNNATHPSVEEKWQPRPTRTEFGSIIDSYKELTSSKSTEDTSNITLNSPGFKNQIMQGKDSYLIPSEQKKRQRHVTLEKYRENLLKDTNEYSEDVKLMLQNSDDQSVATSQTEFSEIDIGPKGEIKKMEDEVSAKKVKVEIQTADYPPERITVPRNKWKKGCIFKNGDSFYDDDGAFLYRVPGLK